MPTHLVHAVAAGSSIVSGIASWLTGTIEVVFLAIIAVMVVRFLFSRQFMALFIWLGMAVVVAMVMVDPSIITSFAKEISSAAGG